MTSSRIIVPLLVALLLAAPVSALAATDVATTPGEVSGLSLAGSDVLYSAPPAAGGTQVFSASPGRPARLLLTLPRVSEVDSVELAGSSAGLALTRDSRPEESFEHEALEIFTAGPGGPFERLGACGPGSQPARVAVDGDRLALVGADCRFDRILVRRLGSDEAPDRVIDATAELLALGGRWLAQGGQRTEGGEVRRVVRVEDASTGEALTELSLRELLFDLDVQEDGTAVLLRDVLSSRCSLRVTVVAPGAASTRDLPGPVCFSPGVRIARDRVAYVRAVGPEGAELVLSDLSGTDVRSVARFPDDGQIGSFDYDGERLAWDEARCLGGHVVRVADVVEAGRSSQAPRCSPRVGRSLRLAGRHARLPISCPEGCAGRVSIQRPSFLQAGRSPRFRLRPGRRATVRVALSRRGLATVRRRGRLPVTISAFGEGFGRNTRAVVRAR